MKVRLPAISIASILVVIVVVARAQFKEARQKADEITCVSSLKQIDGAKESWALEQKRPLGSPVSLEDLVGTDKYIKNTPTCQAGGKYFVNVVGVMPTCSIQKHNLGQTERPGWHGAIRIDWPQWLGPSHNGRAAFFEKEPTQLSADLKPLWRISIGGGFSSPVVAGDKLVYFDEDGTNEVLHQIDVKTGKELWKAEIAPRFSDEWGAGPRATPIIDFTPYDTNDSGRVYAQSCNGEFRCVNFANGKELWRTSFEKDWGVKFLGSKANEGTASRRGNNGTGIIGWSYAKGIHGGDAIVVPVGSTDGATLVSFNKTNGVVRWKIGEDEAAYSSAQGFYNLLIYLSAEALMRVNGNGELLWRIPLKTNAKRHTATPVLLEKQIIVNSHTFGMIAFNFDGTPAWTNKEMKINLATPVAVDGFLYSHGPKKNFVCIDAETGKLKWEQPGFGKDNSSIIAIGKKLLVLTDDGQLVLLAADPDKYTELGRVQVCGKNWNYPAYANGKLYVRDGRELLCYVLN